MGNGVMAMGHRVMVGVMGKRGMSAPMSRHRRLSTSPRRQPGSASSRMAATASGVLAGVERPPEPGEFVRVEEPGDVAPRVLPDAETGIGAQLAEAVFLGPEHHGTEDFEGAVGRAGPVFAHRVERGHVLGTDALHRHLAEGGQDAGLEIDAKWSCAPTASSRDRSGADTRRPAWPRSGPSSPCGYRRRDCRPRGCARGYRGRGGGLALGPSLRAGR